MPTMMSSLQSPYSITMKHGHIYMGSCPCRTHLDTKCLLHIEYSEVVSVACMPKPWLRVQKIPKNVSQIA